MPRAAAARSPAPMSVDGSAGDHGDSDDDVACDDTPFFNDRRKDQI